MKTVLVTLFCACIFAAPILAGEKVKTFSGDITYLNDENRSLVVKNEKNRERLFFVAGTIVRGSSEVELNNLTKGCQVTVSYQKSKKRFIASRVIIQGCQHAEK